MIKNLAPLLIGLVSCSSRNPLRNGGSDEIPPNWWELSVTDVVTYGCSAAAAIGTIMFFVGIFLLFVNSKRGMKILLGGLLLIFAASLLATLVLYLKWAVGISLLTMVVGGIVYGYFQWKAIVWMVEKWLKRDLNNDGHQGKPPPS